tara:strand:- start:73 stop:348 length:276 start_codon:yes stop_codon:yes gene_type:complete
MNDDLLRAQITQLIRDEIQENINDYVDSKDQTEKAGLGFVDKEGDDELKVKISNAQVEQLLKEYKKIKKGEKSNFAQIKKLGLVDQHGRQL